MTSLLVQSPQILQLLDDQTGHQYDAMDLIGTDRHQVMLLHKRLHMSRKTGQGQILCELCGTPVYLVSAPDRQHFFFRHFQEDGSCPSITRLGLTQDQINAIRYQGQRESLRHIRLKTLLAESIEADPSFSSPVVEGTWKGRERKDYRRPDVRAMFNALNIAFEVQLSTTFGSVMAEREIFYKNEGALLLWVFGEFDFERARLMMEVIFANNNRNAFVVNEASRDASLAEQALVLECHWAQPARHEDTIIWTQHRQMVRFDELTVDRKGQRAYYIDVDAEEARLRHEIEGGSLADRFQEFWLTYEKFEGRALPPVQELDRQWTELSVLFARQGVALPSRTDFDFKDMLRTLYLAKLGKAVGWAYQQFWPAVHHVPDAEKQNLWVFVPALQHYGRLDAIEAEDRRGKWAFKMSLWKEGVAAGDAGYLENHKFDSVVRLIFPELAGKM